MIRITKLLVLAMFISIVACEQTGFDEMNVTEEVASGIPEYQPSGADDYPDINNVPIMIFNKESLDWHMTDCQVANNSNYNFCDIPFGEIEELFTDQESAYVRPRLCPKKRPGRIDDIEVGDSKLGPRVPGRLCHPGVHKRLLTDDLLLEIEQINLNVKALSPHYVSAFLMSGDVIVTSTDSAHGGSVTAGPSPYSAQLNFGTPLEEVAGEGLKIIINTMIIVNGEMEKISFTAEL
ncbi:MAG: hypothetical protein AAFQ94_05070 [Bacteroidota bacterium]